jgi:poly(3-hydroxybutyrate) depolymerase
VNGISRTYLLDVPSSALAAMEGGCGAPMLIALHGAGDTGANFIAGTQLDQTASERGFVLAA